MIEWDHRARYGQDFHTWFLGKHLDQWMDSHVRQALDRCWRAFPVAEGRAALIATLELYDRLALRTAEALGLSRPPIDGPRAEVARMLATHDPLTGRFIGLVTRRAPDGREPPPLTDPGQRVKPAGVVRVEARSTAPIHVTSRALWRSAASPTRPTPQASSS
jgi:hypothetical protein